MSFAAFLKPLPMTDALIRLGQSELLPAGMDAADIRLLSRDVRASSLFNARVAHLDYVNEQTAILNRLASGEVTIEEGAAALAKHIDGPGNLDLMLKTTTTRASNFILRADGMDDESRYAYPCWELVRLEARMEPRNWPARWVTAGGDLVDGRMIAPKDAQIWSDLGSTSYFDDGLDSDFPPYAFNSGMGWAEVSREEAVTIGVIRGDDVPQFVGCRFFDAERFANMGDVFA